MHYRSDPSPARILELCDEIMDCRGLGELSNRLLGPAEKFLNAHSTAILQYLWDDKEPHVGFSATHAVDPHYHGLYNRHFFRQDPIVYRSRPTNIYYDRCAGGQLEIFTLSEISDYRQLEHTPYYNDFFRPMRVHHVLAMCFKPRHQPNQVLGIGFHRPIEAPAFDHRDTRLARYIASTVITKAQGLLMEAALDRQGAIVDGLEALAGRLGVMLMDEAGVLLYANHRARADLALDIGTGQNLDTGSGILDDLVRQCRSLPKISPEGAADNPRTELCFTRDGKPVHLSAQVLAQGSHKLRYLITTTARRPDDPLGNGRMSALGLTRREAGVAVLVTQGLNNPEIAEQLNISVRTVENHLRSIYAKADVQSRTQLVGRLIAPN